uniref:Uncharacterized protein n=1 Tax=Anopheles atroparvus TaxID=41427 RepID=A0AAG5DTD8_ANOAO
DGIGKDRTDVEFRSGLYANTHKKRHSPLLDINNIDIIQDVPVGDPLHLLDLGITRKILKGYVNGTLKPFPKWLPFTQEEISHLIVSTQLPSEITRRLKSLKYLPFWKGTELSNFLHIISIAVLEDKISDDAFRHFKLYYTAVTILSSKYYEAHWKYAGELLKLFVEQFGSIYDRSHLTSNVHNLLHIASEVYRFGPLPTLSTYPFENKLQFIKRLVRVD